VTSGFGAPRGSGRHEGIDLSAPEGTPVRTPAAGVVRVAEKFGRWGRMVVVDHGGGWQTRYAHLKRIKVSKGRTLDRGDVIGTVGKSGNATGFHLHYEILRYGRPVDPKPFLYR
jgi:murein DD-endopeptidase MepM/ murein hydrolase activator NlpD